MVSIERRSAQLAQWILYLALSTAIGFAWVGIYLIVASTFQIIGNRLFSILEQIVPVALAASFSAGLLYRITALLKRRSLSNWFAGIIPGIGATFFALFSDVRYFSSYADHSFLNRLIPTVILTYLCGGIALVPLSIPHAMALQRMHRWFMDWAPRASIRSIRHVGYGMVCGTALVATEGTRLWEMKQRDEVIQVSALYGVSMPEKAVLLNKRDEVDPETYVPTVDAHFWIPGGSQWPPRENAVALTKLETPLEVRLRFEEATGQRVPADAKLEQIKWYDADGWLQASRLRTRDADYVELKRR